MVRKIKIEKEGGREESSHFVSVHCFFLRF